MAAATSASAPSAMPPRKPRAAVGHTRVDERRSRAGRPGRLRRRMATSGQSTAARRVPLLAPAAIAAILTDSRRDGRCTGHAARPAGGRRMPRTSTSSRTAVDHAAVPVARGAARQVRPGAQRSPRGSAGGLGRSPIGSSRLALALVAALAAAGPAAAQYGAPANGEWPTYGGDLGSTKYSPLDQIDRENFADLEIAWRWRSADAVLSVTLPGGSRAAHRLGAGLRRAETAATRTAGATPSRRPSRTSRPRR